MNSWHSCSTGDLDCIAAGAFTDELDYVNPLTDQKVILIRASRLLSGDFPKEVVLIGSSKPSWPIPRKKKGEK